MASVQHEDLADASEVASDIIGVEAHDVEERMAGHGWKPPGIGAERRTDAPRWQAPDSCVHRAASIVEGKTTPQCGLSGQAGGEGGVPHQTLELPGQLGLVGQQPLDLKRFP